MPYWQREDWKLRIRFQSPLSGQICLNYIPTGKGYYNIVVKFQSPLSGQICLNFKTTRQIDRGKRSVSIPFIGSNLFKFHHGMDRWRTNLVSIPFIGSNLFKCEERSSQTRQKYRHVSIPFIGSNLFKFKEAVGTICANTFQSPLSGQICLNYKNKTNV